MNESTERIAYAPLSFYKDVGGGVMDGLGRATQLLGALLVYRVLDMFMFCYH